MEKELWYAVSGTGQGVLFTTKPYRDDYRKCWVGEVVGCISRAVMLFESEGLVLPVLKWSDEPVRLTMTITFNNE